MDAPHNWNELPNGDHHCDQCGTTVFAGPQADAVFRNLGLLCHGRPLTSRDFGSASGAIEAAAASERIASLESQLTAARRRDADLRAWVEEKFAMTQRLVLLHQKAQDCGALALACAEREMLRLVLARMHYLTEPSPAAPADDAKTEAQQRVEGAMDSADARFAQAEADDAKPEAGRSSDGNR